MCEHTTIFIILKGNPVCQAFSIRKVVRHQTHCHSEFALDAATTQPGLAANMQLFPTIKEERRHIVSVAKSPTDCAVPKDVSLQSGQIG